MGGVVAVVVKVVADDVVDVVAVVVVEVVVDVVVVDVVVEEVVDITSAVVVRQKKRNKQRRILVYEFVVFIYSYIWYCNNIIRLQFVIKLCIHIFFQMNILIWNRLIHF